MNAKLEISRKEFTDACKLLRKLCKPNRGEEAVLNFDDACLHIDLAGMSVAPPAVGNWKGQVRVPAPFIVGIAKMPPLGDPIIIRVSDGRLHVGTASVGCAVQPAFQKIIELPMNPDLLDILALPIKYSETEIEDSGLSDALRKGRSRLNRKVIAVEKCLRDLGITSEQIRVFIDVCLKQRVEQLGEKH